jgi:hypothetical protein
MEKKLSRRELLKAAGTTGMIWASGGSSLSVTAGSERKGPVTAPELILHHGKITTLDRAHPEVSAVAVAGGRIAATGGEELLGTADDKTQRIDLKGRRVIPGLNDSHTHVIRGGLSYNAELRWDGVPSLADGLRMLKEQAHRTPPGQWVRVESRPQTLQRIPPAVPSCILTQNCPNGVRSPGNPCRTTRVIPKLLTTECSQRLINDPDESIRMAMSTAFSFLNSAPSTMTTSASPLPSGARNLPASVSTDS